MAQDVLLLDAVSPLRRRKLSEELVARIEAMILQGVFPRGSMLPPERELMRLFGVGRASIREALYALDRMGLVEVRNGERPLVTLSRPDALLRDLSGAAHHLLSETQGPKHFQEARAVFEVGVARLAAERCAEADLQRLVLAFEANDAARGDPGRFERTDVAFHYVLASITGNPIFAAVHDALVEWLTAQRTLALRLPQAEAVAVEGHRRIMAAVQSRNADAAGQAMATHLREIGDLIARTPALERKPAKGTRHAQQSRS